MSTTPDKCPHCGAEQEIPFNIYGWKCGTIDEVQSDLCVERAAHAATKRELEEMRARVKKFEPYYLDYVSSVSAAGLPADGPCLACNGFGGHEEGCHGTTGLMTMAYELETLRARVRELEGLEIAQEVGVSEGRSWLYLSVPFDPKRSKQPKTLGEAMPRKDSNVPQS